MILQINQKKIQVKIYTKFHKRLLGFMFQKRKITTGICFPKCNSIHTFFMFQSIDVIMTDKNQKILKIYPNLKPWRIILPQKKVYYTYELPINTSNNMKFGDKLMVKD